MSGEKLSAVLTTLYSIRQTLGKETHKQMMAERERIKLEETMSKVRPIPNPPDHAHRRPCACSHAHTHTHACLLAK